MDYQRRIAALRAGMAERGLAAYLVPADAAMEYLSGVKRVYRNYTHMRQNCLELAGLVITPSDVVYFIPRLTGMGTLPFLEGTAVTKAVSIQDPDLTGETWLRELKALGLSGKHIGVNRDILRDRTAQEQRDSYRVDPKMEEVLRYIGEHLEEDLSVDALANRFYLSRYYLMHRFKAVTGYTLHQYINQKRLLRAGELIRAGVPVMKAAEQAGFAEYSTFLRAFQNTFHMSPREFR